MSEVVVSQEDKKILDELAEVATDTNDIVTLREIAADLGSQATSITVTAEGGEKVEVTNIGSTKFSELTAVDPDVLKAATAVNSQNWQNEQK